MWALSYYLTQLSLGPRAVASKIPDSQRPDVVGKATPDRGVPRKSPDGVDPKTSGWASKRTRKTQRDGHNSGVKIWSLRSVSSTLSHATLHQPFRTLAIKWEVNIIVKKSSCVFLPASLSCVVYSCVCLWYCVVVMLHERVNDYTTVGSRSNGNEEVHRIPQSSRITWSPPSDCLVPYPGHSLGGGVLPLCREAVDIFYRPSRLGKQFRLSRIVYSHTYIISSISI